MIRKIIHCSDIHIKSLQRHDEMREVLENFITDITPRCMEWGDEVRIVVSGDLFDSKLDISNESMMLINWFLHELDNIATTYYFAGNHDFSLNNNQRIDSITPVFDVGNFQRTTYVDMELDYKSGVLLDDNIAWCLFSIFDKYALPDVSSITDKIKVGMIHAAVVGSKTAMGYTMDRGVGMRVFNDMDFVVAGDIHQMQTLTSDTGVKLHYPSSLAQLHFGETVSNHGYSIITVPGFEIEHIEVENPFHFYNFKIKSIDDIDNDKMELTNE